MRGEAAKQCLKGLRRKDEVIALNPAARNNRITIAVWPVRALGLDRIKPQVNHGGTISNC